MQKHWNSIIRISKNISIKSNLFYPPIYLRGGLLQFTEYEGDHDERQ